MGSGGGDFLFRQDFRTGGLGAGGQDTGSSVFLDDIGEVVLPTIQTKFMSTLHGEFGIVAFFQDIHANGAFGGCC